MRYDALIIGAGMSGLGAGIRLAQLGKRVAILERHYLWGGLNSFYKLGGRLFDSGLHALTNFAPRGSRQLPLGRILRQLRVDRDALELGEQSSSSIRFPGVSLRFSNDFELLRSEVARAFPADAVGFDRMVAELPGYDALDSIDPARDARDELARYLRDPLLIEMLLCPTCFYGGAREHGLAWLDFAILFRSIFLEGLSRPAGGIRALLRVLVDRFEAEGGELRLKTGVARVLADGGVVRGVLLESGDVLEADQVFSSAGRVETERLVGDVVTPRVDTAEVGALSFFETIGVLDRAPRELGFDETVVFFNDAPRFEYRAPRDLVDVASGVICTPNNFARATPLEEGVLRVTVLASYPRWRALDGQAYARAKELCSDRALDQAARYAFDPRPHRVFQDTFTPCTIERFTGKLQGAVYGSPTKRRDAATGVEGLHLIGTDHGLVGIVGALLSGITVANRCALSARSTS